MDEPGPLLFELDGGPPPRGATLAACGLMAAAALLFLGALPLISYGLGRHVPPLFGPVAPIAPAVTALALAVVLTFAGNHVEIRRQARSGRAVLHERAVVLRRGRRATTVPWRRVVRHGLGDGFVSLYLAHPLGPWIHTVHWIPLPSDADRERVLALLDRLEIPCGP